MPNLSEVERISGDTQEPVRRIAFFAHDLNESTVIKRVAAFQACGSHVIGFMFQRVRDKLPRSPTWENIELGSTIDRHYLRRLPRLIIAVARVLKHRRTLQSCSIVYARNIDMLLVALLAKALSGTVASVGYEVLDIQRVFVGDGLVNRLFRLVERALLAHVDLLVVSSEDFVTHYFIPQQRFAGPWHLLENKVSAQQLAMCDPRQLARRAAGPPWTIGWFGTLRCVRSLEILSSLAQSLGERVQICLRGLPSEEDLPREIIKEACSRCTNLSYHGPYASPRDLHQIYGMVHFTWCVDYLDEGTNSDWLLPNRLYEGGLFASLALARKGTATARMVEREGLGWAFEEPLEDTVAEFLANLNTETYEGARRSVANKDPSLFIDTTDTRKLLEILAVGRKSDREPS